LSVGKSIGNIITDGFTDETDASVIIFFITNEITEGYTNEITDEISVGNFVGNYIKTF
jgi:hypothetical protein